MIHLNEAIRSGATREYTWKSIKDFSIEDLHVIQKAFDIMTTHKGFLLDVPKKTQYHVESFHHYVIGYWDKNLEEGNSVDYIEDSISKGGLKILHDCLVFSAREVKSATKEEILTMKKMVDFLEDYFEMRFHKTFKDVGYTAK